MLSRESQSGHLTCSGRQDYPQASEQEGERDAVPEQCIHVTAISRPMWLKPDWCEKLWNTTVSGLPIVTWSQSELFIEPVPERHERRSVASADSESQGRRRIPSHLKRPELAQLRRALKWDNPEFRHRRWPVSSHDPERQA